MVVANRIMSSAVRSSDDNDRLGRFFDVAFHAFRGLPLQPPSIFFSVVWLSVVCDVGRRGRTMIICRAWQLKRIDMGNGISCFRSAAFRIKPSFWSPDRLHLPFAMGMVNVCFVYACSRNCCRIKVDWSQDHKSQILRLRSIHNRA